MSTATYYLDLLPNKALLFDPDMVGENVWPNKTTLPAEINLHLTNVIFDILGRDDLTPCNQILSALYSMTGVLAFNISFYNLRDKPLKGLIYDPSKPFFASALNINDATPPSLKNRIAYFLQKNMLKFSRSHNLTLAGNSIYPEAEFGHIKRIKNPEGLLKVPCVRALYEDEIEQIEIITEIICGAAKEIACLNQIEFDDGFTNLIMQYVRGQTAKAYLDYLRLKDFFGSYAFNYFERSLTPYLSALIAVVCKENGGKAHSTYHGVCQTASEPDVATMATSSVFWGVTQAFKQDAEELAQKIPQPIRTFEIKNMGLEDHYKDFIKAGVPKNNIKTVGIMGRHIVMRYSAFNSLEFCAYLHHERQIADMLLAQGYEVVYKAHPECDWRHFDKFFDPRVHINWQPFESVYNDFDALYYHFGASSTLPHALGSDLHIFMLKDGWHDLKIWPSRIQNVYAEHCNMIKGRLGENGLIEINEKDLHAAFQNPVSFDKTTRVQDFFCKRY